MRCTPLALIALLVLSAQAAETAPATQKADYSVPKKAVESFLSAEQAQDGAAIRDALFIPEAHKAQVEAFLGLMGATSDLQRAAKARFRPADAEEYFGTSSSDRISARLDNLDRAEPQLAGDTALIILPADPANHIAGGTIALKRVGDQWKLDADSLFGITSASAEETAQRVALASRLARLTTTISAEINDGAFASASEAYQAYWTRAGRAAKELMPSATGPAASAPTTATTSTASTTAAPTVAPASATRP